MERLYPCELKLSSKCPWPSVKFQNGAQLFQNKAVFIKDEADLAKYIPASNYWEFKETVVNTNEHEQEKWSAEELFKLKKAELITMVTPIAKDRGITGFKILKKQALVDILIEYQ